MSTQLKIPFRAKEPPHAISYVEAYFPFQVFGEKFAVTMEPLGQGFRATHIDTGTALLNTTCPSATDVPVKTEEVLRVVGAERLRKGIASIRARISNAEREHNQLAD